MARSVNKVILIGNLTRDPELRYTPQGHAVCSFGLATNREWVADGEKREAADFHNIVAWNKLAEICAQLLQKGTKTYVEGRLQTRSWDADDGSKRYRTEVVIDEMVILTPKGDSSDYDNSASKDNQDDGEVEFEDISQDGEDVNSEEVPF